jgi:UDP-N-acetylglucosamine transferase subunit ALG13
MVDVLPRAMWCVPPMLEAAMDPSDVASGRGTVVAVGTHGQGFERLLRMVDDAVEAGVLPGPVVAQGGTSMYRPRNYKLVKYLEPSAMEAAIASAEYVICHGGSGIITAALRAGRRPMVLPRRRQHGEHVDDHQVDMLDELVKMGLAVNLDAGLDEQALAQASRPLPDRPQVDAPLLRDAVRSEVSRLLDQRAA